MGRGMGRSGFGGLGDMAKLMKDMQKMQDNMMVAQEEIINARVEATTGGGAVKAIVNGKGRLEDLQIQKDAVDPEDVEMLQDLIISAIQQAQDKAEEEETERMQSVAGNVKLPAGLF